MKKQIFVYKIENRNLPIATKMMNVNKLHFESNVINILIDKEQSLVVVEKWNDDPCIEREWKDLIVEN